jgi:hypothetical protein
MAPTSEAGTFRGAQIPLIWRLFPSSAEPPIRGAHASAFETIGRWDLYATFLAESHPGIGDAGAGSGNVQNSYYGRNLVADFGSYQRSLCNKCHALD